MDLQANASSFLQLLGGQALSRIGIGIIMTDPDGRIQWVNDRQQWFTGIPAEPLLGLSIFEHPGLAFAELHEAIQFVLIKAKSRHLLLRQEQFHGRIEVTPLMVEGGLLGAAVFIYEAARTTSVIHDSGLQLVADEQRAMLRLLSALLDALPYPVAAVAKDGAILFANEPWRSEFDEDALGRPVESMLPPPVRRQVRTALELCLQRGASELAGDYQGRGDGTCYWIAPLPEIKELTLGMVARLGRSPAPDEGESDALDLQVTSFSQFTSHLIHDIRNPLTTLMCELDLLRNENLYEEGGTHRFQSAIDLFDHQVHAIARILEEIEPMGPALPSAASLSSSAEIIERAVLVADWRRPFKSIRIALEMTDDLPDLYCDGLGLQKALVSLLLYALQEAGAAGTVSLAVTGPEAAELDLRLLFSSARPVLPGPVQDTPSWESASFRLAMAYALIRELGGRFRMRRLPSGEVEVNIRIQSRRPLKPAQKQPLSREQSVLHPLQP